MTPARLYLSYGITRSGSTLAFRLLAGLLELAGRPQRRLPETLAPDWAPFNFSDAIGPAHLQAARPGELLAIKTHAPPPAEATAWLAAGEALAHVVLRDPRDIVLSLLAEARRVGPAGGAFANLVSLERAIAELRNQTRIAEAWLALPGALLLRYDELAGDPAGALRRLARQLDLSLDPEPLRRLARRIGRRSGPAAPGYARAMSLADQAHVLEALPELARLSAAPPPWMAPPSSPGWLTRLFGRR